MTLREKLVKILELDKKPAPLAALAGVDTEAWYDAKFKALDKKAAKK